MSVAQKNGSMKATRQSMRTASTQRRDDQEASARDAIKMYEDLSQPPAASMKELPRILVICAETGMGKTYLANRIARDAKEEGRQVIQCSYAEQGDTRTATKIVRRCRDVRARMDATKRPLIVIDGITAPDESEVASEARAIESLAMAGVQVVICIRPEAEQLVEGLSHATCIGTDELLFRGDECSRVYTLTGGIPALVMGYRGDVALGETIVPGQRYMTAMRRLVASSLRPNLMREELRIRLAMVILGHATLDDIALVSGRCDAEQLLWLERDAPLFGVDAHQRICCCHGLQNDLVFEGCIGQLQGIAALEPELVKRACGVLATMGEVRRSAVACRLCSSEQDFTAMCVTWGVSYVGIGEAALVDGALRATHPKGGPEKARVLLSKAAATCVMGTAPEVDEAFEALSGPLFSTTGEARLYRTVQLFGACRSLLRSPQSMNDAITHTYQDTMALACLDHLKAAHLIIAGKFGEAYSMIENEMVVGAPSSLPEALLCEDLKIALALSGGTADAKERNLFAGAGKIFARPGLRSLKLYHDALGTAPEILMSDGIDNDVLVEAAGRAERQGDSLFQAVCLAVASVADVRSHALSRAHVRASKAAEICQTLGATYLASAAELVDALALELLGESGAIGRFCARQGHPEALALIGTMVSRAIGDVVSPYQLTDIPLGTPCPRDAMWVLNLLSNGCGDIWSALTGIIPSTWIELLRALMYRRKREEMSEDILQRWQQPTHVDASNTVALSNAMTLGEGSQTEMALSEGNGQRIRVSVLGGFRIECDGKRMPEGALERRRARDLVTLLALVPGHRMRRYQAIETLWPQTDYFRGPRKLYEATGEARVRLREACVDGANAIVADKAQGSIGFDSAVVVVDVDEFETEARMVLAEDGDDFWVLEHARYMERLYGSGPDEHLATLGGLVAQRIEELRMLYVDGAVAAGEAALRLGKAKLAVRYGTDAHRVGDLREDAMILLVRALKVAGRSFEIVSVYRQYSQRLIDAKGVPPSMALRRVVEQAIGGGPDIHMV